VDVALDELRKVLPRVLDSLERPYHGLLEEIQAVVGDEIEQVLLALDA